MPLLAGRFELQARVAEGGMGVVHSALDHLTGRRVAVKRLHRASDEFRQRLQHEGDLLATLDHPAIVGLIAHGLDDEHRPYLVMRWLEGEDLAARLSRGPLSLHESTTLTTILGDALAFIHGRGLIHRDVKPSNIFLLEGEVAKACLVDFGIARHVVDGRHMTATGSVMGTPGYMAPEQASGEAQSITPAVDVFSLGCVLFECLAGRPAFVASHFMALLAKVLLEEVDDVRLHRADVPARLAELVATMTRKDRSRRPQDGSAVLRALESGLALPPSQHPSSAEARVRTVLVARAPRIDALSPTLFPDHDRRAIDLVRDDARRFGVLLEPLPDGSILTRAEGLGAADAAILLAKFAAVFEVALPSWSVALASGQLVEGRSVGAAIDRAFDLVARGETGIALDETSAAFVESRFTLDSRSQGVFLGAERAMSDASRPLLGRATPCVGRDRELTILGAAFAESTEVDTPRVVLVTAPPGGGKSRLRHELLRRLRARDADVQIWQARGDAVEGRVPYRMAIEIVRQVLDLSATKHPSEVLAAVHRQVRDARDAAFLCELLGASATSPPVEVEAARVRPEAMLDGMQSAFVGAVAAATGARAALVLDDLQWCDAVSAKFLDALAGSQAGPLLIIALARPEFRDVLPSLFRARDLLEIKLPPLPKRAAERLVHEVLPDLAAADIGGIVERSEGNAFFLEELIRAASLRRLSKMPESVLALAQARLDGFQPSARRVARLASVFGETFSVEGVTSLSLDWDAAEIREGVAELTRQEAIVLVEGSRYRFRHALVQEATYSTLSNEQRVAAHRAAAEYAARSGEPGEVVAWHELRAGSVAAAAATLSSVSEIHAAAGRLDAAARCLAVALWLSPSGLDAQRRWATFAEWMRSARTVTLDELSWLTDLPEPVPPERPFLEVLVERGQAALGAVSSANLFDTTIAWASILSSCGAFARATELLESAHAMSSPTTDRRAALMLECEHYSHIGDFRRVVESARRLRPMLEGEPRQLFRLLLVHAGAEAGVGGPRARDSVRSLLADADAALAVLGETPALRLQRAKQWSLAMIYCGTKEEFLRASEATVAAARAAGYRYEIMIGLHNLGDAHFTAGEHDLARLNITHSLTLASSLGQPRMIVHNEGLLAVLDGLAGDPTGFTRAERARRSLRDEGFRWDAMSVGVHLGQALCHRGRATEAEPILNETRTLAVELGMARYAQACEEALP